MANLLSQRIELIRRRVEGAPERGRRRAKLLAQLRRLDNDAQRAADRHTLVNSAGDLDPAIQDSVDAACNRANAYARALIRD